MTKRIFRSIALTAVLALLLTSALLVGTLYNVYENRISAELRTEAEYIVRALDMTGDDLAYFSSLDSTSRVTLITPDGTVLYDSTANASGMDSHAQRPEVLEALQDGAGESVRYSDTLSELTIYYARRTSAGNVLRIANTRSSALGVFLNVAPQIALMLLAVIIISLLIARRSARQIIAPLNGLNLDQPLENEVYDELSPLLSRMDKQHAQIRHQLHDLETAHSELTAIMENMQEGLVLVDQQDIILSINSSAAAIFESSAKEHVGHDLLTLCRETEITNLVQAAHGGENGDAMLVRNGRTYRIFASPVLRAKKVRGVVLLMLDVSAHYAAEASRREFSANVSHELKTPLTSISGYAEIIRDGIARPEDVSSFAGKICTESRRMIALVNDILELSRLDEKQGLGEQEHIDLLPMLRTLTEDFSLAAQNKNLTLDLEGADASIHGYPVLVRELFLNLIDNAIKYTLDGGHVTVTLRQENGRAVCSVADTGIGIPQEHQAHVFERFYRVDKSHSRATGGTGLGLAIVKHVAEIHHAQVDLHSEPGQGTTITVSF